LVPHLCILDEFPDEFLAFSICVHIRSIDEVAAPFEIAAKNCARGIFLIPQPHSVPKVIVPRHSGLTRSPERPNVTYSLSFIAVDPLFGLN